MKILYVITLPHIGGAQTHLLEVVQAMKRIGYAVHIAVGQSGWLTEQLAKENFCYTIVSELVREISPCRDFQAVKRIRKIIQQERPDIVHCHSSKAGIVGRIAAWRENVPSVFTAHGWAFTEGVSLVKRLIYSCVEHCMLQITDKVICVSEYDKQLAERWFLHKSSKLITIHNGIADLKKLKYGESFDTHLYTSKEQYTNPLHLVMVGRFSPPKKHLSLIRAVEQINRSYGNSVRLSLIGDGELMPQIKQYVDERNLQESVCFLGRRTDVDVILGQHDVFCLISNYEGLPISIIEAMRAGLPIVASDVGGVNELVQNGDNGFLIERKNLLQLEDVLKELIEQKLLLKKMGKRSRQQYEEKFTADLMVKKIEKIYGEVSKY